MTIGRLANESDAYRRVRDELLAAEIALRDQRERVAALRRGLPLDTVVEDYVLREGPARLDADGSAREVRLSDLFARPDRPLVVVHYMYGGAQATPCPMCTMWADGYNAVARHLARRIDVALVAQADIGDIRALARRRGWRDLRLVSSAGSPFKTDLGFQDADGAQFPGLSVFVLGPEGAPRHFYSVSAYLKEGEYRGMDLYTPVWNLLDLTPAGRGDWMPSLDYD